MLFYVLYINLGAFRTFQYIIPRLLIMVRKAEYVMSDSTEHIRQIILELHCFYFASQMKLMFNFSSYFHLKGCIVKSFTL